MLCGRTSFFTLISTYPLHKSNIYTAFVRKYCKPTPPRNPYDVLGVENTCSSKDIKKAYIKLCKELHPDRKPDDATQHKKFVELNNAYTSLIDESTRKEIDESLKNPFRGESFSNTQGRYYYRNPTNSYAESGERDIPWYDRPDYRKQNADYYHQQRKNAHLNYVAKQTAILSGCFILVVVGCALYYAAYCYGKIVLRRVDDRSAKIKGDYDELLQDKEKRREAILRSLKKC